MKKAKDLGKMMVAPLDAVRDRRLTEHQLRVLFALFSFRDSSTNLAWPRRATISERCGLDGWRVSHALTALEEYGWIGRMRSVKGNTYELRNPLMNQDVPESSTLGESEVPETGTSQVPESSTSLHIEKTNGLYINKQYPSINMPTQKKKICVAAQC